MSTSEKRCKTDRVTVRGTPDEIAALRARAADVGLSVSGYLIAAGLSAPIAGNASAGLVLELQRLGLQQKALCSAHGGALTPEYRAVLVEILAAMGRIGG